MSKIMPKPAHSSPYVNSTVQFLLLPGLMLVFCALFRIQRLNLVQDKNPGCKSQCSSYHSTSTITQRLIKHMPTTKIDRPSTQRLQFFFLRRYWLGPVNTANHCVPGLSGGPVKLTICFL